MKTLRLASLLIFGCATIAARADTPVLPMTATNINEITVPFENQKGTGFASSTQFKVQGRELLVLWNCPFSGRAATYIFAYSFDGTQWTRFYDKLLIGTHDISVELRNQNDSLILRGADGKEKEVIALTDYLPDRASMGVKCPDVPKPTLEQRKSIIAEASSTISRFLRTDPKLRDGNNIPETGWGEAVKSLKPIRLLNDKVNLKIVMAETADAESGYYVVVPISSYGPQAKNFARFQKLTQADDKTFGEIYLYCLKKN